MYVVRQKRGLGKSVSAKRSSPGQVTEQALTHFDAAEHSVQNNTDRKQEASSRSMNASKRRDDRSASSQKHSSDENIGHQTENNINTVRSSAIASSNSFEEGMRIRCFALEFDGEGGEQDDLHCGARSVPEWP